MRRILVVVLLLTGCSGPLQPPPPWTPLPTGPTTTSVPVTVEPAPTEEPTEEPPPPPSPTDWFDVSLDRDAMGNAYGYPREMSYRLQPATMVVTFHNVGEQPVVAPAIRFELTEPEPPYGQQGGELSTYFTEAAGEG